MHCFLAELHNKFDEETLELTFARKQIKVEFDVIWKHKLTAGHFFLLHYCESGLVNSC